MSERLYGCPECGQYNNAEFWDSHTKEQEGIKQGMPYCSITCNMEDLDAFDPTFRCPICNEEVSGVEVRVKDKKNEEDK